MTINISDIMSIIISDVTKHFRHLMTKHFRPDIAADVQSYSFYLFYQ